MTTEKTLDKAFTDMYNKNIEWIRSFQPSLAKQMDTISMTGVNFCQDEGGKVGELQLNDVEIDGERYYKGGIMQHVAQEMGTGLLNNCRLLVCCSIGLGYTLGRMMDQANRKIILRVYVLERDPRVFKAALHVCDLKELLKDKDPIFMVGDYDWVEINNRLQKDDLSKVVNQAYGLLYSPAETRKGDWTFYYQLMNDVLTALQLIKMDFGNSIEDSLLGLKNMLDNIKSTIKWKGINQLENKFAGHNAILVATGPSLTRAIPYLKEVQGKALIIACDSALQPLVKAGIYPDMVTAIERTPTCVNYYNVFTPEEIDKLRERTWFALATVADKAVYDIIENNSWRIMPVFREFSHYRWIEIERGIIKSGKSSANLAFCMLKYMGFTRIFLLGQDLCMEGGETHAQGSDWSAKGMKSSYKVKQMEYVEGNWAPKVKTLSTWVNFLRYYETDISTYTGTVYNINDTGAKIQGAAPTKFEGLNGMLCTVQTHDYNEMIGMCCGHNDKETIAKETETVLSIFEKTKTWPDMYYTQVKEHEDKMRGFFRAKWEEHGKPEQLIGISEWFKQEEIFPLINEFERWKVNMFQQHEFHKYYMHLLQSYIIKFETDFLGIRCMVRSPIQAAINLLEMILYWCSGLTHMLKVGERYLSKPIKEMTEWKEGGYAEGGNNTEVHA